MDLEAMQLLNLSPIPELSEIELSTMLDHLSGLSDINGDLTDRNVEDIIKEAEDLLDRSISKELRNVDKSLEEEDKKSDVTSVAVPSLKENEMHCAEQTCESESFSKSDKDHSALPNHFNENQHNKHFNSPVDSPKSKIYSPEGPVNHIKSTIDSLKEFSILVEKKLNCQSQNVSPNNNKKSKDNLTRIESHEVSEADNHSTISSKQPSYHSKTTKMMDLTAKEAKSINKSIKLLNCFERLYQIRPVRLSTNKQPRVPDKSHETTNRKKPNKNLKKNNLQEKAVGNKKVSKCSHFSSAPPSVEEEHLNENISNVKCIYSDNLSEKKPPRYLSTDESYARLESKGNDPMQIHRQPITKAFEEVEGIRDLVRKVEVVNVDSPKTGASDRPNPEIKLLGEKFLQEPMGDSGIKLLEYRFCVLKEKYESQMEKLEAENSRLKEALGRQQKVFPPQITGAFEVPGVEDIQEPTGSKVPTSPASWKGGEKITRSVSFENCKAPKNSPCSSVEHIAATKEAFSQTEHESLEKTDNKENVALKKKPAKCKPFADAQLRQKKAFGQETQLLATLRGLQGEISAKEKENRKLKNEIEMLKKQMKKFSNVKVENCRRCHIGTQTIGLGPIMQKPYNPANYEATGELEKENEDLRARIKALEENFESLKEIRINDLQALHQVHEEEMGKLVSKLETQSALTRHLHSLLVSR